MARVGPSPSRRCRKTPITPQEACGHATAVLQGAVVCPPPPASLDPWCSLRHRHALQGMEG